MDTINGYKLITELKNDNSGYSKWGFAKKNNIEYFIKEFLTPIYPLDETVLTKEQILRKREICNKFETDKKRFYNVLNKCNTGNIVTVSDFFRYKNKYYIVTDKIDSAPLKPEDIFLMEFEQKVIIIKIILYGVYSLHKHNIVHGDIKPDNILLKKTMGGIYTAKLIDFDSSFIMSEKANNEELQGDMVYFAPESFLQIAGEEVLLTTKIDIFALGILFHQYLSGELPGFDKEKYDYAFESVLDGNELIVSKKIPENFGLIIKEMLNKHPAGRPTIDEIFKSLFSKGIERENSASENTDFSSNLKNTMRRNKLQEDIKKQENSDFFKIPDDL